MLMNNRIRVHAATRGLGLSRKTVQLIRGCAEFFRITHAGNGPDQAVPNFSTIIHMMYAVCSLMYAVCSHDS